MRPAQAAIHTRLCSNTWLENRKISLRIPFLGTQSHGLGPGVAFSPSSSLPGLRLCHLSVASSFVFRTMDQPTELGDITRLSDHVVRVLGQNPGKFTLQGTNTYIIGSQNPYILIDTAEGLASYIPVLTSALQEPPNPAQPDVSDIVLSHWHHDHVGGLPTVLRLLKQLWATRNPGHTYTPPRLHKYPFKDAVGGHNSEHNHLPKVVEQLTPDLFTAPPGGGHLHDLVDGQTFADPVNGATLLRVLHTPGHTVDSISLYIPQDRALYTADTVLGHGTAIFEDLATYLASLNKMLHFGSPSPSLNPQADSASTEKMDIDLEYVSLYPAHGAVVANGRETISTYIKHRLQREAQVLDVLRAPIPADLLSSSDTSLLSQAEDGNVWTTWTIVRVLYQAYPETLWLPAARGIGLHLRKLEGDGLVRRVGGEGVDARWRLLLSPPRSPSL